MIRRIRLFLLLGLLFLPFGSLSAQDHLERILERGSLRVGLADGFVPFAVDGEEAERLHALLPDAAAVQVGERKLRGLDIDLLVRLSRALDVELTVETGRVVDVLQGVREGRYDLGAGGLTRTLKRARHVAFSRPYVGSAQMVRVRHLRETPDLGSLNAAGRRIVVRAGTTAEEAARGRFPEATIATVDSVADLLKTLKSDEAPDAVCLDAIELRDLELREETGIQAYSPLPEGRLTVEPIGFALPRGATEWRDWVDLFLETEGDGILAPFEAWFPTGSRETILARILARGELRVGVSPGFIPFVVAGEESVAVLRRGLIEGGKPTVVRDESGRPVAGFDVELVAAMARALDVRLRVVTVPTFGHLIPGLKERRFDLAVSGMTRTLSRARRVAFSDPYFVSGIQVMVADTKKFQVLGDLNRSEVTLLVKKGTTGHGFVKAHLPRARVRAVDSDEALLAAVDEPGFQALVTDAVRIRDLSVRDLVSRSLEALEGRRFTSEYFALAVPQGASDWLEWVNLFLREFKLSGRYHERASLYNRWFRSED